MAPDPDPPDDGSGATPRQFRLAKNESFFREVNELVERESWHRDHFEFMCECSSGGCVARLSLTRPEYEHVRAKGTRFLVLPGHANPEVEVVVEEHPGYSVVEKHGPAGAVARADDPR